MLFAEIQWGVAGNHEGLLSVCSLVHIVKTRHVTFGKECERKCLSPKISN